MRDSGVVGAHAFRGFSFDPNLIRLYAQQLGNARLNSFCVWDDLRFGKNQSGIDIAHPVSGKPYLFQRFFKEDDRVRALPFRICRRKIAADITGSHCSEQRIGEGVKKNIAVGMSGESFFMSDINSTNFQRYASLEFVGVPTVTDSHKKTLPLMNADEIDLKEINKIPLHVGI